MRSVELRKLIHTANLLLLPFYYLFGRKATIVLVAILVLIAVTVELLRFFTKFSIFFYRTVGYMLKEEERRGITGATLLVLADFILFFFFKDEIFVPVILIISLSDPIATFVGLRFGRIKLFGGKTLEGALAFWGMSVIIMAFTREFSVGMIWVALLATLLELFSGSIDNLIVPIGTGLLLLILPN